MVHTGTSYCSSPAPFGWAGAYLANATHCLGRNLARWQRYRPSCAATDGVGVKLQSEHVVYRFLAMGSAVKFPARRRSAPDAKLPAADSTQPGTSTLVFTNLSLLANRRSARLSRPCCHPACAMGALAIPNSPRRTRVPGADDRVAPITFVSGRVLSDQS